MRATVDGIRLVLSVGCVVLTACGSGGGGSTVDAPHLATPDAPAGSNTVTGTVSGGSFGAIGGVYWIGSPDSPSTDSVIYMFDKNIGCGDITQAGWDTMIPAGTKILELKMVGKTPMAYPTTTKASHIPSPGESLSSYTVAASTATDQISTGGSVTLTTIGQPASGQFAIGTFHLTFPGGSLDGMYNAPFCQAGREP